MVSTHLGRPLGNPIYRERGKDMGNAARLWVAGLLLSSVGAASAGTVTTVNDTNATDLANALTNGGAGGITITGETLSSNSNVDVASSGLFSTVGTNNYGLQGSGIVISNGDAATDGTSGPVIPGCLHGLWCPCHCEPEQACSIRLHRRQRAGTTSPSSTLPLPLARTRPTSSSTPSLPQLNTRNSSANLSTALASFSTARTSPLRVDNRSTSIIRVW